MSKLENLQISVNATFIGLTVAFLVLLLLVIVIAVSVRNIRGRKKSPAFGTIDGLEQDYRIPVVDEARKGNNTLFIEPDGDLDPEIIAVIMAAITSCIGPASGFRLNAIRRIGNNVPAWNRSGRNEYLATRL